MTIIFIFLKSAKYDLLSNNCNDFSNKISKILTNNEIPSYIQELRNEFLNS